MKRRRDHARSRLQALGLAAAMAVATRRLYTWTRDGQNRRGRSMRRVAQKPYSPMHEFPLKNQCFERGRILAFNHVIVSHYSGFPLMQDFHHELRT
jgi:hypothetical protein